MNPLWFAMHGILHALQTERNMRFHLASACLVGLFAWWLPVSMVESLILLVWVVLVISLELINTAIERTVDLVTKDIEPLARQAKDVAAGSVLIAAIGASVTALIIFGPHIFNSFK